MIIAAIIANKDGKSLATFIPNERRRDELLEIVSELARFKLDFKAIILDVYKVIKSPGSFADCYVFIDVKDNEERYIDVANELINLFEKTYLSFRDEIKKGCKLFSSFESVIGLFIERRERSVDRVELAVVPNEIVISKGQSIWVGYVFNLNRDLIDESEYLMVQRIENAYPVNIIEIIECDGLPLAGRINLQRALKNDVEYFWCQWRGKAQGKVILQPIAIITMDQKTLRVPAVLPLIVEVK